MHEKTAKRKEYGRVAGWIARTLLRLLGWQLKGDAPTRSKLVVIGAPHTSNWDLPFMLLASLAFRTPGVFMVKDSVFWWPAGPIMRWVGGIPVNRRQRASAVQQMAQAFEQSEILRLVITPEGTRRKVRQWKTGFYWIAHSAGVPILPGYIDFKRKEMGVGPYMTTTGDFEADFAKIQAFYQEKAGVTPQCKPREERVPADEGLRREPLP